MFSLFKKKKKEVTFHAVAEGTLIPLNAVGDGVFSEKLLGDGYAVKPINNEVFSPVEGTVMSVFPTKHAITIETPEGLEILVHMGIDTVELKGVPFEVAVKEGDTISATTKLASMDLAKLAETATVSTIIVVITNMDKVKEMPIIAEKSVKASDEVSVLELV